MDDSLNSGVWLVVVTCLCTLVVHKLLDRREQKRNLSPCIFLFKDFCFALLLRFCYSGGWRRHRRKREDDMQQRARAGVGKGSAFIHGKRSAVPGELMGIPSPCLLRSTALLLLHIMVSYGAEHMVQNIRRSRLGSCVLQIP